ncbi:DUF6458 family protein [soil metagenome]
MTIGASIFLLAVGAILAFAVPDAIEGVSLRIIGYILMGAGVLGLILYFAMVNRRRDTGPGTTRVVEERRYRDDGTAY